jgi:DNA-binding NtrC family response regulator
LKTLYLPIIFFSAYQDVLEGAKLSLKYKPFNYIDKSSNIKELLDSVDRAVESYKRIREMDRIIEKVKFKTSRIKEEA